MSTTSLAPHFVADSKPSTGDSRSNAFRRIYDSARRDGFEAISQSSLLWHRARDFIDSTLKSASDTETFQYLSRVVDVRPIADQLYKDSLTKFNRVLEKSVFYTDSLYTCRLLRLRFSQTSSIKSCRRRGQAILSHTGIERSCCRITKNASYTQLR